VPTGVRGSALEERVKMKQGQFTNEQIVAILQEAEKAEKPIVEIYRFMLDVMNAPEGRTLSGEIAEAQRRVQNNPGVAHQRKRLISALSSQSNRSLKDTDLALTETAVKEYLVLFPRDEEERRTLRSVRQKRRQGSARTEPRSTNKTGAAFP